MLKASFDIKRRCESTQFQNRCDHLSKTFSGIFSKYYYGIIIINTIKHNTAFMQGDVG